LRVAVVRELIEGDTVVPAVAEACRRAIARLAEHGAIIEEVSLPSPDRALAAYCVLSAAEAASNMARYDGIRFGTRVSQSDDLTAFYAENRANGFGEEVKRRILFGSYMLTREKRAAYYDAARAARAEIREYMNELLTKYDLIVNPTSPTGALRRGERL
jgi:aspartyl-tRNA(Asn)/glutamyl-tRNA(Gln) amidotransferase subunit A